MLRLRALRDRLRLSLWFVPALCTVAAVLLAVVLLAVDRQAELSTAGTVIEFGGTAEGARSVLSAIAQSMLTFTGLVFSVTMLVLQLASSQLSPRVMRTFLRDRGNQFVLGLFVATFVFTLVVLLEVRTPVDGETTGFIPTISIWVAFILLLASVGAFIYYIDHMAHAIRASTVIQRIWAETAAAIDRLYPEQAGAGDAGEDVPPTLPEGRPARVVTSPSAGVVVGVDTDRLLGIASRGDRMLELVPVVGAFVAKDEPIARLRGRWSDEDADAVPGSVGLAVERTLDQDAAFGFRQLVDIAVRALSPGTNDPTTAVQALDRIHDLLRRLGVRRFPDPVRRDDDGVVRLVLPRPGWDDYVALGLEEITLAGAGQVQVTRRLAALLDDLASVVPDGRRPALRAMRELLETTAEPNVEPTEALRRDGLRAAAGATRAAAGNARGAAPGIR